MVAPPLTSIEPSIDRFTRQTRRLSASCCPGGRWIGYPTSFGPRVRRSALYAREIRCEHAGFVSAGCGQPISCIAAWRIGVRRFRARRSGIMDVCAPIAEPITPSGDIKYMELPATRVVSVLHVGPYDSLGATYEKLEIFLRTNGIVATGPPREIYLTPPDVPADQVQTLSSDRSPDVSARSSWRS